MNSKQKQLKNMVVMFISDVTDLSEQIIDDNVEEISGLPKFAELSDIEIDEVRNEIKSEFSIILDKGFLLEEAGHERWFLAKKPYLEMQYWERYRKYLLKDKNFAPRVVNAMDDVLDTLTDLLGDPARDINYKRRGLIIGDVQSGKTANYTGLICKAVDSGYKVVVLLTGTIEKLRQQTQKRIDEGFVGADSAAMIKQKDDRITVGAGQYDSSVRPMVLTSTLDDFKLQTAKNLNFDLRNINGPVIFVVKKNSTILKRLNKWLSTYNQNGDNPIEHSLLLIDDEADNASVNTGTEDQPKAINKLIRQLLKMFSKSSYVGFTATPFANIFIDPDNYHEMVAEDLFPKDYIYSLDAPSNYIGARDIFGENGDAQEMLIEINDDNSDPKSIACILPLKHKSNSYISVLPYDLKEAIAAFLLANTIEDIRGKGSLHRSMLINISRYTIVQEQVADLVNEFVKEMQRACRLYSKIPFEIAMEDEYISLLNVTFEKIYSDAGVRWETVQQSLHQSCAGIIVQTINQRNGKNVNFDDYKEGLRMIAVGGMSLSRGLTLEGLTISYFYRNSKMYDTLMQMGRWFGYRNGYKDMCRIWMSSESIEWYRYISQATDELREEIKRYEDSDLTPKDFGLRVRSDIASLIVTARNKMKSAESRECVISLSGVVIETPEIYSDATKNNRNIELTKDFIHKIIVGGYQAINEGKTENKWRFSDVPVQYILDFFEQIEISPKNAQFSTGAISGFIEGYRGTELKHWDIGIASGSAVQQYDLGAGIIFNPRIRNYTVENNGHIIKVSGSKRRLGTSTDGKIMLSKKQLDIVVNREKKKNIAQKDYFIGVERNPLLMIYVIELRGDRHVDEQDRQRYDGKYYIGFGIGIPSLTNHETKYARYMLNKIAIQQMFEGEITEWDEDEGTNE